MFTEDGIEIEPFHLRNDIRDGLVTADGLVKQSLPDFERKMNREAAGATDAWLDSEAVRDDQARRLKQL